MSETKGGQLVQRMRLARRVADALLPQEGDVSITAGSTSEALAGGVESLPLEADFVITALDLMLQLSLLVGRPAHDLSEPAVLEAANALLWANPQSAACVIIADDDLLTTRIVEWGDTVVGGPHSAINSVTPVQGPLRETVMSYLSTIDLQWPEPSTLASAHELAFDEVAAQAAANALTERQEARRSPIPERARARASLSLKDAEWATRVALSVANGDQIDLNAELGTISAVKGDRQ